MQHPSDEPTLQPSAQLAPERLGPTSRISRHHPSRGAFGAGAPSLGPRADDLDRHRSPRPIPVGVGLIVECDGCVMQHTSACDDCLVTFVTSRRDHVGDDDQHETLVLDAAEAVAVGRLTRAGLVPALRHRVAVP